MKFCNQCGLLLTDSNTYSSHKSRCKDCVRKNAKISKESHKDYYKKYQKEYSKNKRSEFRKYSIKYKKGLRNKFLEMYGNKCACCGETKVEFLTIEHKLGQRGSRHKEGGPEAYAKALKDYRPDLYEILCYNCNCAKGRYGYCPHNNVTVAY